MFPLLCRYEYEEHIDVILRSYYGNKHANLSENIPGPYSFVGYCTAMLQPGSFGDVLMLSMFSRLLNVPITCIYRGEGFDEIKDPADRVEEELFTKDDGTLGKRRRVIETPEDQLKEHYRFNREFRIHHNIRLDQKWGDKHFLRVVLAFHRRHRHYDACGEFMVFLWSGDRWQFWSGDVM